MMMEANSSLKASMTLLARYFQHYSLTRTSRHSSDRYIDNHKSLCLILLKSCTCITLRSAKSQPITTPMPMQTSKRAEGTIFPLILMVN